MSVPVKLRLGYWESRLLKYMRKFAQFYPKKKQPVEDSRLKTAAFSALPATVKLL